MALEYLERLGRARETVKNIANSPVGEVVKDFAQSSIDEMKSFAPRATGNLSQSLGFDFKTKDGTISLEFLADDYWDFVNSGVDGTKQSQGAVKNQFGQTYSFSEIAKQPSGSGRSFTESISLWMISKGIQAEDGDQESLATAIMLSIKKKGIKPSQFVNKVLNEQAFKTLENEVADAMIKIL